MEKVNGKKYNFSYLEDPSIKKEVTEEYEQDFHLLPVEIASRIGIQEALFIHNTAFWIKKNREKGINFHEGMTWTYNTITNFLTVFPYFNKRKLERITKNLEKNGIIMKSNFNKFRYDRTKWYTIIDNNIRKFYDLPLLDITKSEVLKEEYEEEYVGYAPNGAMESTKKVEDFTQKKNTWGKHQTVLWKAPNGAMESTKRCYGKHQTVPPIPYINTYINSNIKHTDKKDIYYVNIHTQGGESSYDDSPPSCVHIISDDENFSSREESRRGDMQNNNNNENLEYVKEDSYVFSGQKSASTVQTKIKPPIAVPMKGKKKSVPLTDEEKRMIPIIEEWNNIEPVGNIKFRKHEIDYSGHVSYKVKNICKKCVIISQGMLNTQYPSLTMVSNVEPSQENFDKKYSIEEIKNVIKTYRNCFLPEYSPYDKTTLKIDMEDFLGSVKNHATGVVDNSSWFWEMVNNPPVQIGNLEKSKVEIKTRFRGVLREYLDMLAVKNPQERNRVIHNLSEIRSEYISIRRHTERLYDKTMASEYYNIMATFEKFCKAHRDYILKKFAGVDIRAGHFSIHKKVYPGFLEDITEMTGIYLKPNKALAQRFASERLRFMLKGKQVKLDDIVDLENGSQSYYGPKEIEEFNSGKYIPWWRFNV